MNQQAADPLYCAFSSSKKNKQAQFFVTGGISKRCFLVDTGAQVSITPASKLDRKAPPFQAANGSTITTYGTRVLFSSFWLMQFPNSAHRSSCQPPAPWRCFFTNTQLACRHEESSPDTNRHIFRHSLLFSVKPTNLALVEPSINKFRKLLNEFPDLQNQHYQLRRLNMVYNTSSQKKTALSSPELVALPQTG